MNMRIAALVTLIGVTLASSPVFASGFRLPEQSASAMGMASAFVGQADDPSATWYNPAGLTQLDGTQVSGGVVAIYPVLEHDATSGYTDVSERAVHLPFHLYATHKYTDRLAVGLGINNPFGLSTDWAENSSVRYVSTFSNIVTLNINPNVAYKITDDLSVAVGIDYLKLRATFEKMLFLPLGLGDRNFRLSGDGEGFGANAALHYKATDTLNVGLSYRSRMKVDIEGDADVAAPELIGLGLSVSNPGESSVTLPDIIHVGTSYKATDDLLLNADIEYTLWSTYDRLVVKSATITSLTSAPGSPVPPTDTQVDEKNWRDTWSLRLGAQYTLSDAWKLRAGYIYDQSPVDDTYFETLVPDSDRQAISLGAGHTMGNVTIDVAYLYLRFNSKFMADSKVDDATLTPDALQGHYNRTAHLAGITIGYKF